MAKIVIVIEGGLVSAVLADCEVEYALIDYDTDGAETENLTDIPQSPNESAVPAFASVGNAKLMPERTQMLFDAIA